MRFHILPKLIRDRPLRPIAPTRRDQLKVLPTVHMPNVEMPKEYMEAVLGFLRAG